MHMCTYAACGTPHTMPVQASKNTAQTHFAGKKVQLWTFYSIPLVGSELQRPTLAAAWNRATDMAIQTDLFSVVESSRKAGPSRPCDHTLKLPS